MDTKTAINEFKLKVVSPLIADLTRTLEVTCGKFGEDNHGSNFIGNAVVLIGIETVAQFINPKSQEELETFYKTAREKHKKLSAEEKEYLSPKYVPDEAAGSLLARKFMRNFFDAQFREKEKTLKTAFDDLVWAFRNPHSHAFYPFSRRRFGNAEINGGVAWLYRDKAKTGISIKEIERKFLKYRKMLYSVKKNWFCLCPQVLLVHFKKAINNFIRQVRSDTETEKIFLRNYRRLAAVYRFKLDTEGK